MEATADRWFNPEQQMALMAGFDDFTGHDSDQVSALLHLGLAGPADADEALARLADVLQRLSHEATHLELVLRYTRALDAVQTLRTVGER